MIFSQTDASPGRAAGLPLALAAVVILVVVLVMVLRSRRARRPRIDPSTEADQFDDGSGGQ
jgi:hypothetical protein